MFIEIPLQHETNVTKGFEIKESTAVATTKPLNIPVTNGYNTQASKYYKGRPIQSQPRTSREGNLNNSYNR